MADKIVIDISVEGDAEARLRKIGDAAEKATEGVKKGFSDSGRIFDNFVANLASSAVTSAFNTLSSAISSVAGFLKESAHEAAEAEQNYNNLKIALRTAGVVSETAAHQFDEFAKSIQLTTKYSDDAVLNAGALIQQLGKLSEEGLEEATKAAVDLSAALGIDLETAARMVGKAANGEVATFTRWGISIKEGKDIAETFANTLDTLNSKFGGTAAAQVKTFAGAQELLNNQYSELKESIGNVIIQNPALIKLTEGLATAFVNLTNWVTQNKQALTNLISGALIFVVDGIALTIQSVQILTLGFLKLTEVYLTTQRAIGSIAQYVPGVIGQTAKLTNAVADAMLPKIRAAMEGIAGPVENLRQGLVNVSNSMAEASRAQESAAVRATQASIQSVDAVISKQGELTEAQARKAEEDRQKKSQEIMDEIAMEQQKNQMLAAEDQYANAEEIARRQETIAKLMESEELSSKQKQDLKKKEVDFARQLDEKRKADQLATLNYISSLQQAKSKELQVIGKAAAMTTATIDGIVAVQKALSAFPPPFNFIAAGLVGTATAANVARIAGVELATGITEVPAGYPNDTFPAKLTSGERVVDAGTNQDLKAYLAQGGGGSRDILEAILTRISNLETNVTVNVGNKTIVDEVREGIRAGRVIDV